MVDDIKFRNDMPTDMVIKPIKYKFKNKIIILISHQVIQGNFDSD